MFLVGKISQSEGRDRLKTLVTQNYDIINGENSGDFVNFARYRAFPDIPQQTDFKGNFHVNLERERARKRGKECELTSRCCEPL